MDPYLPQSSEKSNNNSQVNVSDIVPPEDESGREVSFLLVLYFKDEMWSVLGT
jgi:hypothetical protein